MTEIKECLVRKSKFFHPVYKYSYYFVKAVNAKGVYHCAAQICLRQEIYSILFQLCAIVKGED